MKKIFIEYSKIFIGCFIYVVGINVFLVPSNIFTTGLMGMAQEFTQTLNAIFDMNLQTTSQTFLYIQTFTYWCLNIPMIYLGFKKVGREFTLKTLVASLIFTQILINVIVFEGNLILDTTGNITLASQILSTIIGSSLIGLGTAIVIKSKCSMGGTDILVMYLSLKRGGSFGHFNIMINLIVAVWSVFLTGSITTSIMILLSLFTQSYVTNLCYNYNKKVSLFIITKKGDEIGEFIIKQKRTFNRLYGRTGYENSEMELLLTVINQEEVGALVHELKLIDAHVFIDVLETKQLVGTFENKYVKK